MNSGLGHGNLQAGRDLLAGGHPAVRIGNDLEQPLFLVRVAEELKAGSGRTFFETCPHVFDTLSTVVAVIEKHRMHRYSPSQTLACRTKETAGLVGEAVVGVVSIYPHERHGNKVFRKRSQAPHFRMIAFAGLCTGLGSALASFTKRTNKNFLSIFLGSSAGVMIYVSFVEIFQKTRASLVPFFFGLKAVFFKGAYTKVVLGPGLCGCVCFVYKTMPVPY